MDLDDFDIGPLTWMKGELDNALHAAHTALAEWNGEDTNPLRAAAAHLHQVYGALQMVDLQGVSRLTAETEHLLLDMTNLMERRTRAAADAALQAVNALKAYLDQLIAGGPQAELGLAPIFEAVVAQRGGETPAPSELFFPNIDARPPKRAVEPNLDDAALGTQVRAARALYQRGLLLVLTNKDVQGGLSLMAQAVQQVEAQAPAGAQYGFWWTAAGLVDTLQRGGVPLDSWVKRLAGRVDLQMRRLMEGSRQLAESLFREVLYYVAHDAAPSGRSAEVRELFALPRYLPAGTSGLAADLLPFVAALKEHLGQAKDHWIRYCGGRAESLEPFQQAASGLFEASVRLPNTAMKDLARIIQAVAKRMPGPDDSQNEALQVEMATALLLGQNAADHFADLDETFQSQVETQTMRVQAALDPNFDSSRIPHVDLLDDISRAAQEKLLLAQVTHEIQANLHLVEEALDKFFRDNLARADLPRVPGLLKQILGALNILQLDVAAQLVREAITRIGHFNAADLKIPPENLNWVAEALSTLGLYVDALRYGRDDPKAMAQLLATPEAPAQPKEESVEKQARATAERLRDEVAAWAAAGGDAAQKSVLKTELTQLARDADLIGNSALRGQADHLIKALDQALDDANTAAKNLAPAAAAPSAETQRLAAASDETIDRELLDTYIEEANEVLGVIAVQVARLQASPYDRDAFGIVRRAFHTLKGSGRMVGLTEMAEPAWEVEQTLNQWLRDERTPSPELLSFLEAMRQTFQDWVTQLTEQGHAQVAADALVAQARQLRGEIETPASALPVTEPPPPKPEAGASAEASAAAGETPAQDSQPDEVDLDGHRLPAELFRIFSDEAAQRLSHLHNALAEIGSKHHPAGWEAFIRAAHTLAGIARTTGFTPLAEAAHAVERWAGAWPDKTASLPLAVTAGLGEALAHLTHTYQTIQAGHFPPPFPAALQALLDGLTPQATPDSTLAATPPADVEPSPAQLEHDLVQALAQQAATPPSAEAPAAPAARDEIDTQLLPIFLEEAAELLPRIGESLRAWRAQPGEHRLGDVLKRALHTLKGSARMAGAMILGEHVHRVEAELIEHGDSAPAAPLLDALEAGYDRIHDLVERLKGGPETHAPEAAAPEPAPVVSSTSAQDAPALAADSKTTLEDELRLRQAVRLKADVLDTLLNEAGEVAIARARIENVLKGYKQTAHELAANVDRLRAQLRELEIQAESQMRSRLSQMEESQFDPLEFDRFSRLQELTRHMAESVNDVSTAQDNLLAGLTEADSALIQQSRMARTLQQELMHMRMVPLNTLAERLYRIVRQSAKETGRRAQLELEGGQTELDRAVLDKISAPLEHLVRNAVAHGIEPPEVRAAADKAEYGEVRLSARQEGNEIVLTLSDDGGGVNTAAVQARAETLGWIDAGTALSPEQVEAFLFRSGFSTATEVTELAGRGIGLDVVKNEIAGIGGRVRLESTPGAGARFTIRLPLTLALTQVVLARAGDQIWALPANLVSLVREIPVEHLHDLHAQGWLEIEGERFPLRTLSELVECPSQPAEGRFRTVLLLKAGDARLALRVDELAGNLEAVVKPIGPQLARIVGVSGATVLGDGRVALILNPFLLAERAPQLSVEEETAEVDQAPLIMVVDDSLTVRKITSRLLLREGYRVSTAKDGQEAVEMLAGGASDELPAVMLLDIEMPRMDGFEVTQHVRSNPHTADLPIIMITSRTADKHRDHALELGVNVYLGKPYQEEELLGAIRSFIGVQSAQTTQPV